MTAWLHHMTLYHPWVLAGLLSLLIVSGGFLIGIWAWIERMK